MSLPFKQAIVTGGLGFIGSRLVNRLLDEGVKVSVVDNHLFGRREDVLPDRVGLTVYNVDIRNREALGEVFSKVKPDAVFHLAAIAFIPKCMEDPGSAVSVHLDGTHNVLVASHKLGVKHLYYSSTAGVYTSKQIILSEESLIDPPQDVYGITKFAGELMFERLYKETGAHTVITRYFNVYGPNSTNRFLIPSIIGQLRNGAQAVELGNLDTERDYVHVDDVVEAIILLMKDTKGFVVANVGSGIKTSLRELVLLFEQIMDRKIEIISKDKFRRNALIDRLSWQADISHINKLIGWKPKISLQNGLLGLIK